MLTLSTYVFRSHEYSGRARVPKMAEQEKTQTLHGQTKTTVAKKLLEENLQDLGRATGWKRSRGHTGIVRTTEERGGHLLHTKHIRTHPSV